MTPTLLDIYEYVQGPNQVKLVFQWLHLDACFSVIDAMQDDKACLLVVAWKWKFSGKIKSQVCFNAMPSPSHFTINFFVLKVSWI